MRDKESNSENTKYFRAWDNIKEVKENGQEVLRLPQKVVDSLVKKKYGVFGHSGVQVCGWTKKSLTGKGVCYKEKFYGIDCHSCMEFTPAVMWCQENCTFCWRPMEFMKNIDIKEHEVDSPEEIVENLKKEREKLLIGLKGHHSIDREKLDDSWDPSHFAISLSGEPSMYPHLDKMVEYLKNLSKTKSIFVVTNGQVPSYFKEIENEPKYQPTQLYVSIESPNKELFDKINRSLHLDGWDRLLESLERMSSMKNTRKVFRMTHIKGLNDLDSQMEDYKNLVETGKPDFIEIKSYMHIGPSRTRHHSPEQMPEFVDVEEFSKRLETYLGNYEYVDSAPNSRITLLKRKNSIFNELIEKFEN